MEYTYTYVITVEITNSCTFIIHVPNNNLKNCNIKIIVDEYTQI